MIKARNFFPKFVPYLKEVHMMRYCLRSFTDFRDKIPKISWNFRDTRKISLMMFTMCPMLVKYAAD